MPTIPEALAIAVQQHQAGELQVAEQIYRQILAVDPVHTDALHLLGLIASQLQQHELAVECISRAIALNETESLFHTSLGNVLKAQGKLEEAIACYRRALELKPDHAVSHYNLGTIFQAQGELGEAAESYSRALALNADFCAAHNNLGTVLHAQGKLEAAVASFRRALAHRPDLAEAHGNLGAALQAQEKLGEAIASFRRALELKPDDAVAFNNLGAALQAQGKLEEALPCLRRALELNPNYAEAHGNLGFVYIGQGKLNEASASYRRALELGSANALTHYNLGTAYQAQGNLEGAVACYRRAVELKTDYAAAHYNLGKTLQAQGKLNEAIDAYSRAIEVKADYAEAHNNLGTVLQDQGKLNDAAACYRRAVELNPYDAEAHQNQACLRLVHGDFLHGWSEYEWRWKTGQIIERKFLQPPWNGEPLGERTILLHAEQGLGDTFQFIRYAAVVKEQNADATVIVECQRPLAKLLATCRGFDRLVTAGDELPPFDVHSPLLSLPAILKTTVETIPANVPYLFAERVLVAQWRERLDEVKGFRVGINWQGWHGQGEMGKRNIPLNHFIGLAELQGVSLINLQKDAARDELLRVSSRPRILDLGADFDTVNGAFMDTAAIMMNLDLVISSDTSIPHLAGALSVPVWLALPYVPNWRWLLDRGDSPWYPTMRLFRQKAPGDWGGVFNEIQAALSSRSGTVNLPA